MDYTAFFDEMAKIANIAQIAQLGRFKKVLPYAATAAGTLAAAEWLKRQKRKYDIGSQFLAAQEGRQ